MAHNDTKVVLYEMNPSRYVVVARDRPGVQIAEIVRTGDTTCRWTVQSHSTYTYFATLDEAKVFAETLISQ